MSESGRRRRYPLWIGLAALLLLALSSIALYLFINGERGERGTRIAGVFGNPEARAGDESGPLTASPGEMAPLTIGAAAEPTQSPSPDTLPAEPSAIKAAPEVVAAPPIAVDPMVLRREGARRAAAEKDWATALRIYDLLIADYPADHTLILERARVLGWSGDYAAAAAGLVQAIALGGFTYELHLEYAQYLLWSGNAEEAAAVVDQVLTLRPGDPAALAVQAAVRAAIPPPSVELARRWLGDGETPLGHLRLARALAREGQVAESLSHYRTVLGSGLFGDSIFLEFASAAFTADSSRVAATALEQYLYLYQPGDRAAKILLARAYGWAELTDKALATYADLLAIQDDPGLRFERAQLLAWNGRERDAERDLQLVLAAAPNHPGALKLLGDLALWRGDAALALSYYQRAYALSPTLEGLALAVRQAEAQELAAREAEQTAAESLRRLAEPWQITAEAFGDSEDFVWFGSSALRRWGSQGRSFGLIVQQGYSDGPRLGGGAFRSTGGGLQLEGQAQLGARLVARAGIGVLGYSEIGAFATWALGLELYEGGGGRTALGYGRQPAVRAALTAASLGTATVLDQLRLTHGRPVGSGAFGGEAMLERFSSDFGTTTRGAGSLSIIQPITAGLSAGAVVRGLAANRAAPVVADWGILYWTPRYFIMPGIQLGYRTELGESWTIGTRATPGMAFIDERWGGEQRFGTDRTAILEAGLDLGYRAGSWQLQMAGDWSGALPSGYRAAALRLRITPGAGGNQ